MRVAVCVVKNPSNDNKPSDITVVAEVYPNDCMAWVPYHGICLGEGICQATRHLA